MLFNGRALIFTFSGTQVRIAEIERLQSLFKDVLRLGILFITFRRQSRIATIGIWSFTLRGARAHTVNLLLQEYHFYKSSICEKCIGATTERDIPYVTFMAKSRLLQKAYTRHCIVYLER